MTQAPPTQQIVPGQLKSLIIWIFVAAGVFSGALGAMLDAVAILGIVVLNCVIGVYQAFSAERSTAALQKMTAPHAKVRRDGVVVSIPASEIVAGDMIALEADDLITANARLLEAASLKRIESVLTGGLETVTNRPEALQPSDHSLGNRDSVVCTGSSVTAGTGRTVVVATAMSTKLGRVAGLIEEVGAVGRTPLRRAGLC